MSCREKKNTLLNQIVSNLDIDMIRTLHGQIVSKIITDELMLTPKKYKRGDRDVLLDDF